MICFFFQNHSSELRPFLLLRITCHVFAFSSRRYKFVCCLVVWNTLYLNDACLIFSLNIFLLLNMHNSDMRPHAGIAKKKLVETDLTHAIME